MNTKKIDKYTEVGWTSVSRGLSAIVPKLAVIEPVRNLCKFVGRLTKFSDNPIVLVFTKMKVRRYGE